MAGSSRMPRWRCFALPANHIQGDTVAAATQQKRALASSCTQRCKSRCSQSMQGKGLTVWHFCCTSSQAVHEGEAVVVPPTLPPPKPLLDIPPLYTPPLLLLFAAAHLEALTMIRQFWGHACACRHLHGQLFGDARSIAGTCRSTSAGTCPQKAVLAEPLAKLVLVARGCRLAAVLRALRP